MFILRKVAVILSILMIFGISFTGLFIERGTTKEPYIVPGRDYLIVVNDDIPYDFDGEYNKNLQKDIVFMDDVYGEATPAEKATLKAFQKLQKSLKAKGMTIGLLSGYRTKEDQQGVYDYYSNLPGWSETNKVSQAGFSEHHTGLVLNILILYQGEGDTEPIWYTETEERRQKIEYFKLLHENLADFGFIDRYPPGKESITGVPSEPYEIRFVGSAKIAHEIMDNGLCLEEYLSQHKNPFKKQ